ncbi:Long-chain-alcohol oxidase FAO4A [Ananas comosus]|uniref:Long-chain-alcohol oxidase n=1 Tax=Ananas comosus TaxID=4615 RepID=A0A199W868_ANACO|nr:Long-chain-alcohol oxidase FAO4A [Ananas comosus]
MAAGRRSAAAALAGGRRSTTLPNLLSEREMDSLTAICDTLLPSVDVSHATDDEDLIAFYRTSASMAGTPHHVACLLSGGVRHPAIWLLRVVLWLLSTWYGALLMCGRAGLSDRFPYVQKFSRVDGKKREQILLSWSCSRVPYLQNLFKSLKYLATRSYFAQANEKNENPSWKAMGYCGPDPNLQTLEIKAVDEPPILDELKPQFGSEGGHPITSALLHMASPKDSIIHTLRQFGFPTPTPPSSSSPLALHCDVVVVGSGAGGSVAAGVLAKAGHKVIVLEKGQFYDKTDLSLLEGPTMEAMYEGRGMITTDDVSVLILAGATVGGGSAVNWSASIRTPDHVRREWCDEHGLELFGSKAYDRALDAVCGRMGVQSDVADEGFNNMVLRRGCTELGYPVSSVPCNAPPDHYCGWCHLGCKDGKKKGTTETWLADVARSGNGLILPDCKVERVLLRRKGKGRSVASGVLVQCCGSKEYFVIKSKATVVAAGALNTPALLKRSGLRNAHIGKNLHLHPSVLAWGYFPRTKWPAESKRSYEGGIITCMSTALAEWDGSGYGAVLQTPALHPGMFAALTPWLSAADFRERMLRFARTAHVFALVRDKGSGAADRFPESLAYRMDGADEENMRRATEAMVRVLAAAGAEEVGTQHCKGERARVGEEGAVERLVERIRSRGRGSWRAGRTPVTTAHQMGSCRMGTDATKGAVSPRGEAWEAARLFVADTSVFPTALGVNPMVTAQAVAYCTAHSILQLLLDDQTEELNCTPCMHS